MVKLDFFWSRDCFWTLIRLIQGFIRNYFINLLDFLDYFRLSVTFLSSLFIPYLILAWKSVTVSNKLFLIWFKYSLRIFLKMLLNLLSIIKLDWIGYFWWQGFLLLSVWIFSQSLFGFRNQCYLNLLNILCCSFSNKWFSLYRWLVLLFTLHFLLQNFGRMCADYWNFSCSFPHLLT